MKKKNLLGLGLAGILVSVALASCGGKKASSNILSFQESYDTSVLAGIGLLDASSAAPLLASMTDSATAEGTEDLESNPEAKPEANGLDKLDEGLKADILSNLALARNVMGGSEKSETLDSDLEGYAKMYTITKSDGIEYVFYYNELDKNDTDELDDEEEMIIEGIVKSGDMEYQVRGKKELEKDEEENEYKVIIDDNNYVIIQSEFESGETEFEYTKVENGVTVYQHEVEYEMNKDGEIELSFEAEVDGIELEYSYSFITLDGKDYIDVEIEKNDSESKARILVTKDENGKESYEFLSYSDGE